MSSSPGCDPIMKISRIDSWYIGMENPDLFKKNCTANQNAAKMGIAFINAKICLQH